MADGTTGHSDHQAPDIGPSSTAAVPELGRFIYDLIKCRKDVIGKLDLCDGLHALCRSPNGKPYNPLLCQRGVEYTFGPKLRLQVHGATKHAPKCYIFAKE